MTKKKFAFTLFEIIVITCVIGILAAIALPAVTNYTDMATAATAQRQLHIFRNAIRIYKAQYGVAPGYKDNNPNSALNQLYVINQLVGTYLPEIPVNPLDGKATIKVLQDEINFPNYPMLADDVTWGWVYQPATMELRLYTVGKDTEGVDFFDY